MFIIIAYAHFTSHPIVHSFYTHVLFCFLWVAIKTLVIRLIFFQTFFIIIILFFYLLFWRAKKEIKFFIHFTTKAFPVVTLSTFCLHHVVICKKRVRYISHYNQLLIAFIVGESNLISYPIRHPPSSENFWGLEAINQF